MNIYLWRQVFILSANLFLSLSTGFMVSFPSVLTPALTSPNSTDIRATPNQASWIATSNGFAGIFGFFILSPILQLSGRKVVFIVESSFFLIGWIIFSLADNTTALFAARIIQGLAIGGIYINGIIVSEYSDSTKRGSFIACKKVSIAIGTLMCHALSIIWSWRQIAMFAIIQPIISIIITLFWPESPYYLAMKGRFKDCERSFIWLHGESNIKELYILLASQKVIHKNETKKKWYKTLFKKDFLKPLLIASLLTLLLELSGKYYFVVFVLQIMTNLIGDKSIAMYCTLGADGLIIVALLLSCFIINYFKRRAILFSLGLSAAILMLLICLFIILKLSNVVWLVPGLILLLTFIANVSVIPVCFTLISEIFPLEHKGNGSFITGIIFTIFYTLILKITPMLMDNYGVQSIFATYSIGIIFCLVILYFTVPETKDRTLQDIENGFKGIKTPTYNEDEQFDVANLVSHE